MRKHVITLLLAVCALVFNYRLHAQGGGGSGCTPIPWYTMGNTIGLGPNIFGTLDASDVLLYGNGTQIGQFTGITGNTGNFEIGIAGTLPQNKLLVENGTISTATSTCGPPLAGPYADLCGLPIGPSDIGIYSYSNNLTSGNNIGVAAVADANAPIQAGYIALIQNASNVNAGMFVKLLSNTAGVSNNGVNADITATSGNNNGFQANITDNNSNANSTGYNASINGAGGNVNQAFNATISAANAYQNVGANYTINGNNATYENEGLILVINGTNSVNYGISGNVTGSGTPQQWGVSFNVAGTVNNTGIAGYVGNTSETNSINIGVLGNSTGGAGCTNSGFSGSISGNTGCLNSGTYTWLNGNDNNNWGILSPPNPGPESANIGGFYGLSGANSTDIGVEAQIIDGGGSPDANSSIYGVIGSSAAQSCLSQVGVWGYLANNGANCTGGYQYAVWGTAPANGGGTGVTPGTNGTCPPTYAGYFEGDVFCSNTYYYSDPKLKTNITSYTGALETLNKIPVKQYDFDNKQYPYMNLPLGHQVGVLSTDMKQLFPNLVKSAYHPSTHKDDQAVSFDAVNYNALIPVMIQAIQEVDAKTNPANTTASTQQAQIESLTSQLAEQGKQLAEQNKQITNLTSMLNDICNLGCAGLQNSNGNNQNVVLFQSIPNPTSGSATIGYVINIPFTAAHIMVTGTDGEAVRDFKITQQGKGSVVLEGGQLASGTFRYSLYVDDKLFDTKSIVILQK